MGSTAAIIKIPVIYTSDVVLSVQPVVNRRGELQYFVHCDVRHWAASVARDFEQRWQAFREAFPEPLYALHEPDQANAIKFARSFGFQEVERLVTIKGEHFVLSVHAAILSWQE